MGGGAYVSLLALGPSKSIDSPAYMYKNVLNVSKVVS